MSNDQYKLMCNKILSNQDWYKPILRASISRFEVQFYALVGGAFAHGIVDQDTWEFLCIKYPRIPTFYCLPKVH